MGFLFLVIFSLVRCPRVSPSSLMFVVWDFLGQHPVSVLAWCTMFSPEWEHRLACEPHHLWRTYIYGQSRLLAKLTTSQWYWRLARQISNFIPRREKIILSRWKDALFSLLYHSHFKKKKKNSWVRKRIQLMAHSMLLNDGGSPS